MTEFRRGDKVHHLSADIVGATRGTVLAVFPDMQGRPCVAVQWYGGYFGVSRAKWIDHTLATTSTGARS